MAAIISAERNDWARQYRRIKYRLNLTGYGLTALYLILLVAGGSRWVGTMTDSAVLLVGLLCLGWRLLQFPVAFARYRHDRRYGVSAVPAGSWFREHLLVVGLVLALQGGLAWLLLALWQGAPAVWHLWVTALAVAAMLTLSLVGPWLMSRFIAEATPLPDGERKERLTAFCQKAGFPITAVSVSNAGSDMAIAGAYVSGHGAARRIILDQETISPCTPDELEIIMGHELGHVAYHHVVTMTLADVGGTALVCLVPGFSLEPLSAWLGLGGLAPQALPLLALLFAVVLAVAWPLRWAIARQCERVADAYALRLTGKPEAAINLWHKLAASGQYDLEPPRWVYFYRCRQPTIPERIAAAETFAARQQ
jgi:STE24 endopeptidase